MCNNNYYIYIFNQLEQGCKINISKTQSGISLLEWSYKDDYIATKFDGMQNCVFIWDMEFLTLKAIMMYLLPIKSFTWSKNSTTLTVCTGSKIFFWNPTCTSLCDMPFDKNFHAVKIDWSSDQKSMLLFDKSDVVVAYPTLDDIFLLINIYQIIRLCQHNNIKDYIQYLKMSHTQILTNLNNNQYLQSNN